MKYERYAKLLVFDDENNVLVLRRSSTHPWAAFEPDLPGGIVEEGESFEEGVIRELIEETGITTYAEKLVRIYTFKQTERNNIQYDGILFGVRIDGTKPIVGLSWEHDQYTWTALSDIEAMRTPNLAILQEIIASKAWEKV